MKIQFILIFSIFSLFAVSQSITFGPPILITDGDCTGNSSTFFQAPILSSSGFTPGTRTYMVDAANVVLYNNAWSINSAIGNVNLPVQYSPTVDGDFKIFSVSDDPTPDFALGTVYTGTEIGALTFDPAALDSDCSFSAAIPTLSQWGLIILGLFVMIFGLVALRNPIGNKLKKA